MATPEPPASAEFELTATALPRTIALDAGAVSEPVGLVTSLVTVNVPVEVRFWPFVTVTVCTLLRLPTAIVAKLSAPGLTAAPG